MSEKLRASNQKPYTSSGLCEQEVQEQARCRDDIDNLLSVTEVAALFLDNAMRIRGLTPPMARLLNLGAGDKGRMLADLLPDFHDDSILDDAVQALQERVVLEEEVIARDGTAYLRRIQPYRTQDNRIDGVAIAFMDISARKSTERQLADAELRLAAIRYGVVDGIIGVGRGGVVSEFNPAAERMFACSAQKAVGQPLQCFLEPVQAEGTSILQLLDHQAGEGSRMASCKGIRKTGESFFPIEVCAVKVPHSGGYLLRVHDVGERRSLGRRIVEHFSLEQQRIGQLIHNGLGQQLAAVSMLASALAKELASQQRPEAAEAGHLKDQLEAAVIDSKALVRGLSPVGVEPTQLVDALKTLADEVGRRTGVQCFVHDDLERLTIDRIVTSHLYRIAEMALDYAVRNGAPSHIDIRLEQSQDRLRLWIYDDGDRRDKPKHDHGALERHIMAYRASIIGGTLTIQSQTLGGKQLLCDIPLAVDAH